MTSLVSGKAFIDLSKSRPASNPLPTGGRQVDPVHLKLREEVASEYGFRLARLYPEKHAARFLEVEINTLRRKRRKRLLPFVDRGDGSVGYMGWQVADIILLGVRAIEWPNTQGVSSSAATGGSKKEGRGYYAIRYVAAKRSNERRSLGTSCLEEAKQELTNLFLQTRIVLDEKTADASLADVLRRYYEQHASTLRSAGGARDAINRWLDYWGEATVAELRDVARQEKFHDHLRARGQKPSSMMRVINVGRRRSTEHTSGTN